MMRWVSTASPGPDSSAVCGELCTLVILVMHLGAPWGFSIDRVLMNVCVFRAWFVQLRSGRQL
jgi:hypothetical protein